MRRSNLQSAAVNPVLESESAGLIAGLDPCFQRRLVIVSFVLVISFWVLTLYTAIRQQTRSVSSFDLRL